MSKKSIFSSEQIINGYWNRKPSFEWLSLFLEICTSVKKGVIADIGCGNGEYGRALFNICGFKTLFLIDSSFIVINKLLNQTKHENQFIIHSNVYDWRCSKKVDLLLVKSLIHHLDDKMLAISHLSKQLTKGGVLVIQSRTREQFLTTNEFENYLNKYCSLKNKLASRYPSFNDMKSYLYQAGLKTQIFSYVDIFEMSVNDYLLKLKKKIGNSILSELSLNQHKKIIRDSNVRYYRYTKIKFYVPMTVWVARSM